MIPRSIPDVLDVHVHAGERAVAGRAPDLLVEVPHGATRTADFERLAARLTSPLPPDLVDFFHVNTDAGAPELAEAVAREYVRRRPERVAAVLRCRIPRTFIDCNRRMDATPEEFAEGRVTPGLMPWVTAPEDRALLRALYDAYVQAVRTAAEQSLPSGAMILLHTYAPREVDVQVDAEIAASLRRAYAEESRWPLRPEVDVIGRDLAGRNWAPGDVVTALSRGLAAIGLRAADGATYPLHPSTLAHGLATRWEGRVLCVEVRRDLLADPFEPFAQMRIGPSKVRSLAAPLAEAALAWG